MGLQPVKFRKVPQRAIAKISTMAIEGENTKVIPQLLDTRYAQVIINIDTVAIGRGKKRKGLKRVYKIDGIGGYTLGIHWYNKVFVVGYNKTVSVIDMEAQTETIIKSDFSETAPVSAESIGTGYIILGSGGTEKLTRLSITLDYKNGTGNFTAGKKITDGTTGATAIIDNVSGTTANGTLTLSLVDGTFGDGNDLTDNNTGVAKVDGDITHTSTEINDSPTSKIIEVLDTGTELRTQLFTGQTFSDESEIIVSEVDDGSFPPYENWTQGTNLDQGFKTLNRTKGKVRTINSLGQQIVVGQQKGRNGFTLSTDSSGLVRVLNKSFNNRQSGLYKAMETDIGLVCINKSGAFIIPVEIQGRETSNSTISITQDKLEDEFFDDVNLDNVDIIEDTKRDLIYFTMAKDSQKNNLILAYNKKTGSLVQYLMNINRFTKIDDVIYGFSSIDGRIFEMFIGSDDDGQPIPTDYQQELQLGDLSGRHDLSNFIIQALIVEGSTHFLDINIKDNQDVLQESVSKRKLVGEIPESVMASWGTAGYGISSWTTGLKGSKNNSKTYQDPDLAVKDFYRVSVRLTSNDKYPAEYNFFQATIIDKEVSLILNNLPEV